MIKTMSNYFKVYGFSSFLLKIFARIFFLESELERCKKIAWRHVSGRYGREIAFGPFKGMILSPNSWWSQKNMTAQILGTYESHIMEELEKRRQKYRSFIDIGAADGYYAVGCIYSGFSERCFAFEISPKGRKTIYENAKINGCEEKVTILAEANYDDITDIVGNNSESLVLIDIEGSEFDFLSDKLLQVLKKSTIICELHPFLVNNGEEKLSCLLGRCHKYFDVTFLKRKAFEIPLTDDLDHLPDDIRLLAFSEGRRTSMQWILLEPKGMHAKD